jgi:predicted carbohydrate-binding protein with CBM5 and CBM33 domain
MVWRERAAGRLALALEYAGSHGGIGFASSRAITAFVVDCFTGVAGTGRTADAM